MRVTLSPESEQDLVEIGAFIAEDSPHQAEDFIEGLQAACLTLSQSPRRFPIVIKKNGIDIRRAPRGRYSIFYVVRDDDVYVLHIVHSARDYERILFPEED